jgi:hypothetical protein
MAHRTTKFCGSRISPSIDNLKDRELLLKPDELALSTVKLALATASARSVEAYGSALSIAASDPKSISEQSNLKLLSALCGMMLEPDVEDGPFRPVMQWNGQRTMLPEDLTEDNLLLLTAYAEIASFPDFSARLYDVLWLRKRDRSAATKAIQAYVMVASDWDSEMYATDRYSRLSRASQLALSLGKNSEQALAANSAIVVFLDEAITRREIDAAINSAKLALRSQALCAQDLIDRFYTGLGDFATITPTHLARRALQFQAGLYQRTNNDAQRRAALRKVAETFIADADRCASEGDIHPLSRSVFMENAIHAFMQIPKYRNDAGIVEQIETIRVELNGLHANLHAYMKPMPVAKLDNSDLIEQSIKAVEHDNLEDSILALVNLVGPMEFTSLKNSAQETLNSSLFSRLFSATHHDSDGRVTAKEAAVSTQMGVEDPALWVQMMKSAACWRLLTAQKMIAPALEWITEKHYISEKDLEWLVFDNNMVPPNRAFTIAKGILAGFRGDFATSTAILIPQFENILRHQLKTSSILTTKFDKDGIEDEKTLDALIDLAIKEGVVNNDIAFDLKATLTDRFGGNLRNLHAHGLLSDQAYFSDAAVYFWATALKWVALPRLIVADVKMRN